MDLEQNELYPVFLKLSTLQVLIVGGGNVGLEKLSFILKSSPSAQVTVVSEQFIPEIIELARNFNVTLAEETYHAEYISGKQIVIAATDKMEVNLKVREDCKKENILINIADNPAYCDFYMGGIVTKGNLKIAISTNGKSPTTAKRLRQFFEEVLPDDLNALVENLNEFRKTIKGSFEEKVSQLNELTKDLISKKNSK